MKVIKGHVDLALHGLKELPDLSDVKINGDFECQNNNLMTLSGSPIEVTGDFCCWNNSVKFTEEDVRKVCKVGGNIFL